MRRKRVTAGYTSQLIIVIHSLTVNPVENPHLIVPGPYDFATAVHRGNRLLAANLEHYSALIVTIVGRGGKRGKEGVMDTG